MLGNQMASRPQMRSLTPREILLKLNSKQKAMNEQARVKDRMLKPKLGDTAASEACARNSERTHFEN
jgi:hypothetical protein